MKIVVKGIAAACCVAGSIILTNGSLVMASPAVSNTLPTAGVSIEKSLADCGLPTAGFTVNVNDVAVQVNNSNSDSETTTIENSVTEETVEEAVPEVTEEVVTEENATQQEAAPVEEASEETEEVSEEAEEKSEYADIAIAQVEGFVNVREDASSDSEVVGQLDNNAAATVVSEDGDWYGIISGDVIGFVNKAYVVVGDEELAKSVSSEVAVVQAETLNVRAKKSKDAEIVGTAAKNEELTVLSQKNAWTKVQTASGEKGYVSADYVIYENRYEEAKTTEEVAQVEQQQQVAAQVTEQTATVADTDTLSPNAGETEAATDEAVKAAAAVDTATDASVDVMPEAATEATADTAVASSAGQSVIDYACQFIGNPYVWGGTSLTNGADCSGFIMSVYANFGVSLPHSSSAMRSCGTAVSGEPMPGDIICYDGHVALYVGNGQIVHASNPTRGIVSGDNYQYRPVVAIRRVI